MVRGIFRRMMFRLFLLRVSLGWRRRDYELSYKLVKKMGEYAREENVFYTLLRAYLSMLNGASDDAAFCLGHFYRHVLDDDVRARYQLNDDEVKWFLLMAEYMFFLVSSRPVIEDFPNHEILVRDFYGICFSNVRAIHKLFFSPGYMDEIKKVIGGYR